MHGIGEFITILLMIAAFTAFAVLSGIGIALWSIWLPITVFQALAVMGAFGVFGATLAKLVIR